MKKTSHLNHHDLSVLSYVQLLEQVSSGQLQRLCFSQPELSELSYGVRTRSKLLRLYKQGHLRRFPSLDTDGWVYLPGESRATRIDHHTLDIAEVYIRLEEASRLGMCQILEWVPHERVTGKYADDAYLWLSTPLGKTHWHLEIDRGSESKPQLREKMRAYTRAFNEAYKHGVDTYPQVLYVVTFDPRKTLETRKIEITSVIKEQSEPDLFDVVTIDQVLEKLVSR